MRELYLDPSLYEFVDGLDPESYDRFCAVTDALARALLLMSKLPDACTVRAFGVTVRVERNKAQNYYVICAIHIVDLDPPPEGWGKNPAALLDAYFDIAPDCISDRVMPKKAPPEADRGQRFIGSRAEEEKIQLKLFNDERDVVCHAVGLGSAAISSGACALDRGRGLSGRSQPLSICGSGLVHVE